MKIEGEKVLVRFVEYGNEDYTTLDGLKPAGPLANEDYTMLDNLKPAESLVNKAEDNSIYTDKKEKTWAVGDLCVARWEEDQVWYNSKIIEIHGEKALVRFVDYGNEDFANLSQLKPERSLDSEGSPPQKESQHKKTTLEDLDWNVDDFCVAKSVKFNQIYNSQIMKINADSALVYFIEFSINEELPFSALLPFGPYAVNKQQKLVEFKDSEDVCVESIDGWKDGDECVAKWVQDNSWYNSKILKIFSETEVLVQFTEFGNADFTNIFELKPLQHSSQVSLVEDENTSENTSDIKEISTINKQAADSDTEKGLVSIGIDLKQNRKAVAMPTKDKVIEETHGLEVKIYHQEQRSINENLHETG